MLKLAWFKNHAEKSEDKGKEGLEIMAALELHAEPRTVVGRGLKRLRDQGYIPAVLYGHGIPSQPLQVEERALNRVLAHGGSHGLISLRVAGAKEPYTVVVREIQRYPTRRQVLHVDFYRVVMTEKLRAEVPLVMVGESPAVASGFAALVQNMDSVEVECLPDKLPSALEIDISQLRRADQSLCIGDIVPPEGVHILEDPETVVVSLAASRIAREEAEIEAEELAIEAEEVEVVTKGKEAKGVEEGEQKVAEGG